MTGYSIIDIEDAVLVALQAQMSSYVKTIESYQGELTGDFPEPGRRLPATLVMLKGSRSEKTTSHSYDLYLIFAIVVIDRNLRGNVAGRRGNTGIYRMLEDVRLALWDHDLGLEINPFILLKEEALVNNREIAAFGADYQTVIGYRR